MADDGLKQYKRPNAEDLTAEELIARFEKGLEPHSLRQIKLDLKEFWGHFKPCGPAPNQCIGKCRNEVFKLKLLREYAEKSYPFKRRKPLAVRREEFRKARRLKGKFRWPCFVCGEKAEARHHIIELQHGATNAKKNVIPICHRCHAKVHPWLRGQEVKEPGTFDT